MRINVKPFTHWVIYRKYKVRFHTRAPNRVTGILTTPSGPVPFRYEPHTMTVYLPDYRIQINEHGWELAQDSTQDYNTKAEQDDENQPGT